VLDHAGDIVTLGRALVLRKKVDLLSHQISLALSRFLAWMATNRIFAAMRK
jgi:hypothetical protein